MQQQDSNKELTTISLAGVVCVHKDGICKRIKVDLLDQMLEDGWQRGKLPNTDVDRSVVYEGKVFANVTQAALYCGIHLVQWTIKFENKKFMEEYSARRLART